MKKLVVVLLAATTLLSSCAKINQITEGNIDIANLPAAVSESLISNYPDAVAYSATELKNGDADYIVTLNTQEEVAFKGTGECLGDGSNMHGERGGRGGHGGPDGAPGFDRHGMMGGHHDRDHEQRHPNGGGHGCGNHRGHEISLDSLPAAAKAYLAANYASFTPRHAEIDTLCSVGATISVAVRQAGAEPLRLFFDAAGTFVMKGERTKYADAPAAVSAYITANYTGYSNRIRTIKFTLADASVQYVVFLRKEGMPRKAVNLKADGTFICEK
jgi:Putative beta-lactamase-inhibitor-like, PepSY-like